MVWTSFIWYGGTVDCWNLNWTKIICLTADMAAKLCTPKHQVQCMRITNTPRKKRESLLCEVVCQPLREKDWATRRRTNGSERQQRRRKREAATATGAVRDDAGDGATGSEWECESERELDFSWEGETGSEREWCNVWSLNLVFLVCSFFCAPEESCDGWHVCVV